MIVTSRPCSVQTLPNRFLSHGCDVIRSRDKPAIWCRREATSRSPARYSTCWTGRQVSWGGLFSGRTPGEWFFGKRAEPARTRNFFPVQDFLTAAAGSSGAGELPSGGFSSILVSVGRMRMTITPRPTFSAARRFVSRLINAVSQTGRIGGIPSSSSPMTSTAGFYDHVATAAGTPGIRADSGRNLSRSMC